MATEIETTKPRLVKAKTTFEAADAQEAAAFTAADHRKLRAGQDRMRKLAAANTALEQELLNLKVEMADREESLRLRHAACISGIMAEG